MELGTHNSMTYLKPKKWYLYPFLFIARCQSKTIEEQFDSGIRLFDIRVRYNKDGDPEFRHGAIAYKGDVYEVLNYLNSKNVPIKIRIILEVTKYDFINEVFFTKDLMRFPDLYPNLTFYEGRRKYDWKQVYPLPTLDINQLVGSMSGSKLYAIYPELYAKKYNEANLNTYLDYKPLLIDFLNEYGSINSTYTQLQHGLL